MVSHSHSNTVDDLTMLQVASNWHLKIASELENPILPDSLTDSVRKLKLEEIGRQREKHKAYSQALNALVSVQKNQMKRQG
jgi:hypothetical protein